jgi:hypothetical protein
MARLTREAGPMFRAILPIDAPSAIEASPRGVVTDDALWTLSGGADLVKGILDLAASIRQPDVIAARELITARIGPALDDARAQSRGTGKPSDATKAPGSKAKAVASTPAPPAARAPAPPPETGVPAAVATAVKPAAPSGKVNPLAGLAKLREKALKEPAAARNKDALAPKAAPAPRHAHPLIADWQTKVDALIAQVEGSPDPEDSGFMQSAGDAVMEMLDAISEPGVLTSDNEWIRGQFQEAMDTIILMQMESGENTLDDAATLLLQLSRDIAVVASA